jgi:hypothetical protein
LFEPSAAVPRHGIFRCDVIQLTLDPLFLTLPIRGRMGSGSETYFRRQMQMATSPTILQISPAENWKARFDTKARKSGPGATQGKEGFLTSITGRTTFSERIG